MISIKENYLQFQRNERWFYCIITPTKVLRYIYTRMLESLDGCLTELCASDFYWIFFSFRLSLIFYLRYQFSAFFQAVFQADENPPAQIFPEQLSKLIISIRFNVWGTFLSNYKYFSCQSSCLLSFLEVCKNPDRKEDISIGGSEQQRNARFWIHLRETWLE